MNRRRFFSLLLLALICTAGAPFSRAADPATFVVGPFTFKRPASFSWMPVNPAGMRKAQLKFADPASPSGPGVDVVFFHFGTGQGGGVEANISRWLGQFSETGDKLNPVVETATVGGTKVTRVRVERGTFSSGMPGGPTTPMADYGMQGAILESAQGDVFIKMTGPAAAVKAASADFEALVSSALQGDKGA
ncbi:MAG: hypothetical protein JO117_01410 [Verrucomicrobia bacterium]|nr:hypothetical protein [Verrucomicrobiota bacterium]MBV9658200.1 hypothetical protein [Verrucomicrobiota bacterium]